jgi:hypothetical protein
MVNDISIITGIVTIFIFLGVLLPYVNAEFGVSSDNMNIDNIEKTVGEDIKDSSFITIFSVLFSVLKMFFWTFGALPFWLDMIFIVFRVILGLTIARNVWVGGGG